MELSYKDKKWTVMNGLMSGWKVTNLFGTLINRSMIHIVCEDIDEVPTFSVQHGDDVDLEVSTVTKALQLMERLQFYGFEVSSAKTSVSTIEFPKSEFLKTVSLPDSLHGYAS